MGGLSWIVCLGFLQEMDRESLTTDRGEGDVKEAGKAEDTPLLALEIEEGFGLKSLGKLLKLS